MATLPVCVTPKAGRDEIAGWRGAELSVRVTSAPEGGKANAAVCRVIAEAFHVPKTRVRVLRGDTARHKLVEIEGVAQDEVQAAVGGPEQPLF